MTIQTKIKEFLDSRKETSQVKKVVERRRPEHLHMWKVVGKTYAPPNPISIAKDMDGSIQSDAETMQKSLFGVTTLLWECESCGETKKNELLGSDEDMLESVINKAERIGPQFVERRGKSFIISEWKPIATDPNMIPVK